MTPVNAYLAGFLSAIGLTIILWFFFKTMLGKLFFVKDESNYSFDKTVDMIRNAIENQKEWTLLADKDFNEAYRKNNLKNLTVKLHEFKLGNPIHSYKVNLQNPAVSVFMPASIAVVERIDGEVEIIRKNTSLLGEMFPGEIGKIMREEVPSGLDRLLCGIKKDKTECKSCEIDL